MWIAIMALGLIAASGLPSPLFAHAAAALACGILFHGMP